MLLSIPYKKLMVNNYLAFYLLIFLAIIDPPKLTNANISLLYLLSTIPQHPHISSITGLEGMNSQVSPNFSK